MRISFAIFGAFLLRIWEDNYVRDPISRYYV